jgi:hypothetical protein
MASAIFKSIIMTIRVGAGAGVGAVDRAAAPAPQ